MTDKLRDKLRKEIILASEDLLSSLKTYDDAQGNPFSGEISRLEKGLNLILFRKETP